MNPDRLLSLPGSPSDIIDEENNEFQLNKINVSYLKAMQTLILKSELKASIIFDPDIELVQDLQPGDLPPIDTFYKKLVYRIIPHKNFPKQTHNIKCCKCKQSESD